MPYAIPVPRSGLRTWGTDHISSYGLRGTERAYGASRVAYGRRRSRRGFCLSHHGLPQACAAPNQMHFAQSACRLYRECGAFRLISPCCVRSKCCGVRYWTSIRCYAICGTELVYSATLSRLMRAKSNAPFQSNCPRNAIS
eukprot:3588250-Rhodomonas_salina.1